jgi:phospholipase C
MSTTLRKLTAFIGGAVTVLGAAAVAGTPDTGAGGNSATSAFDAEHARTATPIKHLVVIYDENISFDHYFGTYPYATNPPGEPRFRPAPFTPRVNNLLTDNLLTENPNLNPANGAAASNPFRLDRTQASTTDQDHSYTPEQLAYDAGRADLFPLNTGTAGASGSGAFYTAAVVMGYYDGNTVTALWNYAQHFAMSDNHYGATYGPSTPGALEVVSGQTNGYQTVLAPKAGSFIPDGAGGYTDIGDVDPAYDACSSTTETAQMLGKNIGDLLNQNGISWGGFMGGFDLGVSNANGSTGCARTTTSSVTEEEETDYIPHHAWFQYFASTRNPTHARPSSVAAIGHTYDANGQPDPANHQYDVNDFYAAVEAGNFPAVAYLKAPAYQDGHAGYSDPLDEQAWIVQVVNFIEQQPQWKDTAIVIDWDDSDGWYDHAFATPSSASYDTTADQLDGPGICGSGPPRDGLDGSPVNGRCGPGPRLPFMVISPYAKLNYVSHTLITQASVVRFIEDNWLQGQRLGGGSFDATAGSINDMFDFARPFPFGAAPLYLSGDHGTPVQKQASLAR